MARFSPKKGPPSKISVPQKRVRVELNMDDIVADPGLRKSIYDFDPAIRDEAKRAYLFICPCQPHGHAFPQKWQADL
jgi:hypothetical protein